MRIRLLGRPSLERDGGTIRLEGRKTWALLAYLLLESRAPTRRELVDRLWSEADDPLGAARWTLSQVRKALAPAADIVERDGRLRFEPREEVAVDAWELLAGAWNAAHAEDLVRGPLLESVDVDESPEFARWLGVQRARIAGALGEAVRSMASDLARSEPDRALVLAERGLSADPFDDGLHELVLRIHVGRGDAERGRAYLEQTRQRYRAELGIEPPVTMARVLSRPPAAQEDAAMVRPGLRARALLDGVTARSTAGDAAGAVEIARRAVGDAAAAGDRALEAEALTLLVNAMTQAMSGEPREWLGLLRRASALADELDDPKLRCDIDVERGRIGGLVGHYGAAEAALRRAITIADAVADPARVSFARRFLGVFETDRCDYGAAEADLRAAALHARTPEFSMAWLARLLVKVGRLEEAADLAERCVEGMRRRGSLSQLPLVLLQQAEIALARDEQGRAADLFAQAFTHANENHDEDWIAMALRGLAIVDRDGRPERAHATLADALTHATSRPGCYRWVEIAITAQLAEWGAADAGQVQRALRTARAAPMPDLAERLERAASHTLSHTVAP